MACKVVLKADDIFAGGYMEYTFRIAAEQLFGVSIPLGPLPMRRLRNADFQETTLEASSKLDVIHRPIQNAATL